MPKSPKLTRAIPVPENKETNPRDDLKQKQHQQTTDYNETQTNELEVIKAIFPDEYEEVKKPSAWHVSENSCSTSSKFENLTCPMCYRKRILPSSFICMHQVMTNFR